MGSGALTVASFAAALFCAVGLGALVAGVRFSVLVWGLVALIVIAWLVALLVAGRRAVRNVQPDLRDSDVDVTVPDSAPAALARVMFYLGTFTLAIQVLRFGGFALSDYLFAAALLLALIDLVGSGRQIPRVPVALWIGVGIYAVGAFSSSALNAVYPNSSYASAIQFVLVAGGWFVSGAFVIKTREQLERVLWLWIASTALCAAWAVGQKLGVAPQFNADATGRLGGLSLHPNALGAMTGIVLMPTLVMMAAARSAPARITLLGAFLVIVAGLGVSGSISGASAGVASLLVGLISQRTTLAVALSLILATLVAGYAIQSGNADTTQIGRFATATSETAAFGQGSLQSRVEAYRQAWDGVVENPLVGRGLDWSSAAVYTPSTGSKHLIHNLVLGSWYESGLLGLLGVLTIFGVLTATAWQNIIRATSARLQLLSIGLMGATVAMLTVSMAEPVRDQRFALFPACLVVAMYALRARTATKPLTLAAIVPQAEPKRQPA